MNTARHLNVNSNAWPAVTDTLIEGETPGDQITGTAYTLYKVRAKNSDSQRGKSGGYRIIYYLKTETHCILVTLYSKSDQGDIAVSDLNHALTEIENTIKPDTE